MSQKELQRVKTIENAAGLPMLPAQRGFAGETVEPSHQLDGTLRAYRGDHLLVILPLPLQEYGES